MLHISTISSLHMQTINYSACSSAFQSKVNPNDCVEISKNILDPFLFIINSTKQPSLTKGKHKIWSDQTNTLKANMAFNFSSLVFSLSIMLYPTKTLRRWYQFLEKLNISGYFKSHFWRNTEFGPIKDHIDGKFEIGILFESQLVLNMTLPKDPRTDPTLS